MKALLHPQADRQLQAWSQSARGSLLIHGPAGVGKKLVALDLARQINCLGCSNSSCRSCRMLEAGTHPDLIKVAAAKSSIGIESIHQLEHQLRLSNYHQGGQRVVIIEDAHLLSLPAQNALLKTLEEPPQGTIIILTAVDQHKLVPTILSRCQKIYIPELPIAKVAGYLKSELDLSPGQSQRIAELSQGRLGRALVLAQNPQLLEEKSQVDEQIKAFLEGGLFNKLKAAASLAEAARDQEVLAVISQKLRDRLRQQPSAQAAANLEALQRLSLRLGSNVGGRAGWEAMAVELQ
jgi:DNA polymerase-3 subunit delta'